MRKASDYKPVSNDKEAELLAQCSPRGLVWDNKGNKDSNLYKTIKSLATAINAVQGKIYEAVTQWDINITTDLILEWETAVGIPDECRGAADDIAIRRSDVLSKLKKVPVITIQDYKDLAESITGETGWDIRPGSDDFPNDPLYKFIILVTSPTITSGAFRYPFGSGFESGISLNRAGTTVTATVTDTSTMVNGGTVTIAGANEADFNGDHVITSIPLGTTFTYEAAGVAGAATGTITVNFGLDQTQLDAMAGAGIPTFLFTPGVPFEGYPFSGEFRIDVLQCVFRKVTPANVIVVFT